ncbi:alkaline phosphatase D family protein [Carboxylicivirga sp. N1Y90]|uniref:alkaline phosphatase D family protein n=1 Tax=Carboxylicivirga fragile TaxID=3417571 RepID=UPI003D351200|nr:alkaline phosphatase family protein [Marinilabiliaceae bacterium N1Y90]
MINLSLSKTLLFLVLVILCSTSAFAQKDLLQSGPMVGYSTMKEVMLWAQTNKTATVHFEYWNKADVNQRYLTDKVKTIKTDAFVARCVADQLEPGCQYEYQLYINNKSVKRPYKLQFETQTLWQWRTDAPDFSFGTGSCAFINEEKYDRAGKPYGGDYQIFKDIYKKQPQFFLWLGDNVYLREADWNSVTGINHRYTHTRSTPEMQAMLGSMHHYAIWDDHDYGPNDSDRSYHLKKETLKTFKNFFANPNYIFDEGTVGTFQWADCDFFLTDNRYWRTPNNRDDIVDHDILGEEQMQWLLDALSNSGAPFKFVVMGGQFISPLKRYEKHANIAPKERSELIRAIERLKIEGVVFISGDVHITELSKLEIDGAYPLYDLTVSPLTSGIAGKGAEENPTQVEGTLVRERNYSLMKVSGKRGERVLTMTIYNSNGKEVWTKQIHASELKFEK